MREHILLEEDVAPGTITFDDLILDRSIPLDGQAETELKEDLFQSKFPNGCVLDIGWYPSFDPGGQFIVAVNQNELHWEPFLKRECRSIADLKRIVAEVVEIVKKRPPLLGIVPHEDAR